jgi:hypothetical protein
MLTSDDIQDDIARQKNPAASYRMLTAAAAFGAFAWFGLYKLFT